MIMIKKMEQKVIDFSKLGPDLSRFSLKAKSFCGCWLYAQLSCNSRGEWGLFWTCPMEQPNAMFELNPETFCQCTGLKDSDGKLIYENDYFEIFDNGLVTGRYLVQYHSSLHFQIKNAYIDADVSDLSFVPMWMEHGRKVRVVENKFDKEEKQHA